MKVLIQFIYNLFLTIDQMLNTILLGHPDETLSSRLGRTINNERYFWVKYLRIAIDWIFFFDKKYNEKQKRYVYHCEKSVMPLEQKNFRKFIDYEIWRWNI